MKLTYKEDIILKDVPVLRQERTLEPVFYTDETMNERKQKVINLMKEEQLDTIVIYGDLEHGSNFEYLTGFLTRFEEGVLVLHKDGSAYILVGNENLNKVCKSRIKAEAIHVPYFSLPNQPMNNEKKVEEYFKEAGIKFGLKIGLVGWKMFTSSIEENMKLYDVPYYIVKSLENIVGVENLYNKVDLFIGGNKGARTTNNANEIAHYEFGSQLASEGILKALDLIEEGISEMEIGNVLNLYGQPNSVVTIASTGERFEYANLYPTSKKVKLQDQMSLTVGYKGGLSSRAGYAVKSVDELPKGKEDYLEVLAKPYFAAIATWLENIHIGMLGGDLYQLIEDVIPKSEYNWYLNPGHLFADEEWMSSPIYERSTETLKNGMLLQTDIIPNKNGYAGVSCESGIALANKTLKKEIEEKYPYLYEIFEKRKDYVKKVLNINVNDDVILMNDTVAYYSPFILNKKEAFRKK